MSRFVFVASRDPVSVADSRHMLSTAADLAGKGADVAVYLVQNGVFATRDTGNGELEAAQSRGVKFFADDFSLRERGINPAEVRSFIQPLDMDQWVGKLFDGERPRLVWH